MIVDIAYLSKYVYTQTASTLKASEKRPKAGANQPICMIIVEHVTACLIVILDNHPYPE